MPESTIAIFTRGRSRRIIGADGRMAACAVRRPYSASVEIHPLGRAAAVAEEGVAAAEEVPEPAGAPKWARGRRRRHRRRLRTPEGRGRHTQAVMSSTLRVSLTFIPGPRLTICEFWNFPSLSLSGRCFSIC